MTKHFLNTRTNQFPVFQDDIKKKHPLWSEENRIPSYFVEVQETEVPELTFNQKLEYGTPELVDGEYRVTWIVTNLTPTELTAKKTELAMAKKQFKIPLTEEEESLVADIPVF